MNLIPPFPILCSVDAFRLTNPQWTFSTPRLLHTASIDMKASFATAAFYTLMTNPAACEWLNLPAFSQSEVQAWSAVVLASGLVYRSVVTQLQQAPKVVAPEVEMVEEKKLQ